MTQIFFSALYSWSISLRVCCKRESASVSELCLSSSKIHRERHTQEMREELDGLCNGDWTKAERMFLQLSQSRTVLAIHTHTHTLAFGLRLLEYALDKLSAWLLPGWLRCTGVRLVVVCCVVTRWEWVGWVWGGVARGCADLLILHPCEFVWAVIYLPTKTALQSLSNAVYFGDWRKKKKKKNTAPFFLFATFFWRTFSHPSAAPPPMARVCTHTHK